MIVIATQVIYTTGNRLTVELLKHDYLDEFYIYTSADLAVTDMVDAETALSVYNSYAEIALSKLIAQPRNVAA